MSIKRPKQIVVVGGGTGTHTLLRGLKRYVPEVALTAVVSMADSGGSTGRLRDEFGHLPVGDVRNVLTALADEDDTHYELLRSLFTYRFQKGEGLAGHNFGNLLLTALTDILGSEVKAIEASAKILRVAGRVMPVTTDNVHLVATYSDGTIVIGEHDIDDPPFERKHQHITALSLTPPARMNEEVARALFEADLIVLGPGDLYTSVLANCVVDGFADALRRAPAPVLYVCNLMSRPGQTIGMHAQEHIEVVTKYAGRAPEYVLVNSASLPAELARRYEAEGTHAIVNNCMNEGVCRIVAGDYIAKEAVRLAGGDTMKRSLVRHDSDYVASVIIDVLAQRVG